MSTAKRIGGDWVENIDSSTGKTYYANLKTKVTTWHYPAELSGKKVETSPADWVERQDPKTGRMYYYNPKTKDTTWVKPTAGVAEAASDLDASEQWTERVDKKTGRTYYVNAVTRKTTWTNPNAGAGGGIAEEPSYKPAPVAPMSRARQSVKLGALRVEKPMPTAYTSAQNDDEEVAKKKSIRISFRRSKSSAASSIASDDEEDDGGAGGAGIFGAGIGGSDTTDRFAKLRALRNKKDGEMATEVNVVGGTLEGMALEEEDDEPLGVGAAGHGAAHFDEPEEPELSNIEFAPFLRYAKDHFRKKSKGFMSKSIPLEKLVAWGKQPVKRSLHELSDSAIRQDAVQMFKNVLSYMGDRDSSKKGLSHCQKILGMALHAPEELRDELYCQIIKQTTKNPGLSSCVRGWQLMSICAGTFPPSKKLEKYLMSYCYENSSPSPQDPSMKPFPEIQPYAHYALMRLARTANLGPRREVPIAVEINAAKERQPVVQRVHILNRESKTIPVEAWTTVGQMSAMMAKKLGILDPTPFAIFEYGSLDEERVIDEDDRVLDVLAYWKKEHDLSKKKVSQTYTFVYKLRLFFDIPDNDTAAIDLAYMQAVHDVTDSRYPCSEQDCITLAALQAQERYGDYKSGATVFEENLAEYLPTKFIRPGHEAELVGAINKVYGKLKGYSSDEAKSNYIDYVKSWKIYGSVYFYVEPQNSRDFPDDVVLAINAKGILVVDPSTKDFLAEYPYSEVVTWGHSAITFVLVIGNLIRSNKIYFKTDQGAEINSLVHAYVNRLLDTK